MSIDPMQLRRVDVFHEATDEDLHLFWKNSIERSIEEGEYFFLQGDPASYLFILTSGRAKLLQTNRSGQQVNLRTINEWQIFGAVGAVREGGTYPASAQAMEQSTALALPSEVLHTMMENRPYLSMGLMKVMTDYIQEMQERYRELATEKVERRIARSLVRLTVQMGMKTGDGSIELAFTRQELAEMSGTTLYTVSRVLSEWEKHGLVETGRERVRIRTPHELVKIAEELE
ncbi:MAG: Crp/Fnr family transcriptional regulator [Chloroflexota bacterium]